MCGIAGFVSFTGRFDAGTMGDIVRHMADSMAHRGPDDSGVWVDPTGCCALSHRRLSIIDLSAAGHQPMILADRGDGISFNGEIYNYQEIRAELESQGTRFKGQSDTEVLLAGLSQKGSNILDKLDGMFAFGFWQADQRRLLLARDIFGEKPLYYAQTPDGLAFASELQALREVPGLALEIDRHRIEIYFSLRYLPAPLSIYKQVSKLPAGSFLSVSPEGKIAVERYYRFLPSFEQKSERSLEDLADELEVILTETVRSRLVTADVPVGAFLSSGVDSSLVVALAMKHVGQPIKSFSVGFLGDPGSEHQDAEATAFHLGSDHRTETLSSDFFKKRGIIPEIQDEPMGDSSCLPTWAICRSARRDVTVALSGDGGDELFGGYNRYPKTLERISDLKTGVDEAFAERYLESMMLFSMRSLGLFLGELSPETRETFAFWRDTLRTGPMPFIQRMRMYDIELYLPEDILAKVDRMSMAHSLEVRSPLLGRKVADFAAGLATENLVKEGETKILLKKVAARHLPEGWLQRRKKGFSIPKENVWDAADLTRETEELVLASDGLLGQWVAKEKIEKFIEFHKKTPVTNHLWVVFVLEKWFRRWKS